MAREVVVTLRASMEVEAALTLTLAGREHTAPVGTPVPTLQQLEAKPTSGELLSKNLCP
jgi:hypothetical protein